MESITWDETGATLEYSRIAEPKGLALVFPGGGYRFISPRERKPVADAFAQAGWQPFVLTYSTGENLGTTPLQEAAWAVRTIRSLDTVFLHLPLTVCGFSAGGHLAASLGVHYKDEQVFPDKKTQSQNRPDSLILGYPVITAGEFRHDESFNRLARTAEEREFFSVENHVTPETPPAFLWHTAEDATVPVENSLLFAEALKASNVPFGLHVYPTGPHGMSLATPEVADPEQGRMPDPFIATWFGLALTWLEALRKYQ